MAQEPDLLIEAGFSASKLVADSNKVVAEFRKRGEEAQKAFQDATGRVTDTSAARAHARELDRLSKAYDPVYRAASTYEAEVKRLDRALDVGAITQTQYTAKVGDAAAQFQRASAAIAAGSDQMVRGTQRALAGTTALTRSTGPVVSNFRRFGPQIQQAGYQFGDFAVQVGAGTSAMQAAGQQAPQLLGAFGPLGAMLGLVAAVAFPLANAFLGMGKEAESLEDKVKALEGAITDYTGAVEAANTPTDELVQKYGNAAVAAQGLLAQIAQLSKIKAGAELAANGAAIATTFEDLSSYIALADGEIAQFGDSSSGLLTITEALKDQFGLTLDQARQLQGILADQAAAKTVQDQAAAMQALAAFLNDAAESAQYANAELNAAAKAASEGSLAGLELATALEAADVAAGGVVATVDQLPGSINAATASALAMAAALRTAISVAQSMPGAIGPDLNRFGNGADITRRAGGLDLQEQQNFRYDWQEQLKAQEEARRKAEAEAKRKGRKGGSGRKERKEKEERPFFENIDRDLENLERELTLIGKSNEEVATAKARWEMLDEAKRRGLPVNEQLAAQIDAQAAQFGRLTGEVERAETTFDEFTEGIDTIVDAFGAAISAKEDFFGSLKRSLIDAGLQASLNSLKSSLAGVFGGTSLGSFIGNVFGGGGLPGRATGGPVSAGSAYMVGEQGPEPFIPAVNGRILSVQQAQQALRGGASGGGGSVALTIDLRGTTGSDELDRKIAAAGREILSQVPDVMNNRNKRSG